MFGDSLIEAAGFFKFLICYGLGNMVYVVFWRFACLRRNREGCLVLKPEIFTSLLIVLMGSADCVTTFIGILYSGAAELNPFMASIVSTNIAAFLTIKMAATFLMGFTCIQTNKTLMKTKNRSTKVFKYSCKLIKITYAGIIVFLVNSGRK